MYKRQKNNNAKYVGFGNGGADKENPVAGDSSAIIINGREASLDMSNIREQMCIRDRLDTTLSSYAPINQLLSDYSPCLVEALLMDCNRYWSH